MHPRVGLHQVALISDTTADFVAHCRAIGISHMTLSAGRLLEAAGFEDVQMALSLGGPRASVLSHPFGIYPDLERDEGGASEMLLRAIEMAAAVKADHIYCVSGGRGSLSWEAATERFAELIAPCRIAAEDAGISLLVETTSNFYGDLHIAHTLEDTIVLAETAGIGVCIDLPACWFEGNLIGKLRRAVPLAGLVQVGDYVPGDRSLPCRAVPGDGAIPLMRLIAEILGLGYEGIFDLELLGPRIEQEGARSATRRGAQNISTILGMLGA